MPIHSANSRQKLLECHPDLQLLVNAVSEKVSLIVVCGHRGHREQNEAYMSRRSQLPWPMSKHNQTPSLAVDLAPLGPTGKLSWDDLAAFKRLGTVMKAEAARLKISIKWGGDFVQWHDFPHYELTIKPRQAIKP